MFLLFKILFLPSIFPSSFLSGCVMLSLSLLNTGMGGGAIPTPTSLPGAQDHLPGQG